MKNTRDPNEPLLFDNTTVGLTPVARNLLKGSWWELMRTAILRLMPVERIGAKLSEKTIWSTVAIVMPIPSSRRRR